MTVKALEVSAGVPVRARVKLVVLNVVVLILGVVLVSVGVRLCYAWYWKSVLVTE
jgi:hypothetical protein